MTLESKKILITGAAVRLGRILAISLGEAGAIPIIHYHSSEAEALSLLDYFQQKDIEAYAIKADLSIEEECSSLICKASEKAGSIDGLINNAAVYLPDSIIAFDWQKALYQLRVNLLAPVALMQAVNVSCKRAAIINILDNQLNSATEDYWSYSLTKQALFEAAGRAAENSLRGITVNAIAPGSILTPGKYKNILDISELKHEKAIRTFCQTAKNILLNDEISGQIFYIDTDAKCLQRKLSAQPD